MVYRLLVRRIWTLPIKDLCCPTFCGSPSIPSPLYASSSSLPLRSLSVISSHNVSFSVQDNKDFTERVINSSLGPVLVGFHAQWCGPCKILGPRLEKAIAKQQGRVAMAKVDIDEHTDLALEYGVSAVPTVIAIRGGNVIDHFVGIKDEEQLNLFVSKLIGQ
ncbi:LOW QUALITY PROTEIN: thioredoxin, mitochondrial-like [Megalops cyprinoides]|uniref:LOW QUALITY PROTEIN: thioredoxin, mitochondrial-like n=1 Tax=Megalops cyprinoides TaxID=118141 RepID=UPI0018645292|nr:LOW QUALITY PROTEIN: thioredoxin, mitochondrial-like [Megalops cyprinoides]